MKRDIVWTTKFKKDYKLAMKRHMDIGLLDDIIRAGEADVNLVVSYGGLEAARILQRRFGTPY